MRRQATAALAALGLAVFVTSISVPVHAQRGGQDQGGDDDAKKRKRDEEWGSGRAPLPALRNAGPCPYVKVLYDAARYVEFADNKEATANVGYTGEIEGLSAACAYKDAQPIKVQMQILFELGRGPHATSNHKTYRYWVAVTHRNEAVLAKEYFDLPVTFPAGQDRVSVTETLGEILIPRNDIKVSGGNFEVLVGFDVTPEMADFNRQGKRFRANAGQAAASPPAKP
ncbi:MAG TPA: Tat pathway signal sequence domain protein [Caulobacteraceae bacterium]|nr:Tat pathway signal sequence domain protein [Caulobacteraceae bacterium]